MKASYSVTLFVVGNANWVALGIALLLVITTQHRFHFLPHWALHKICPNGSSILYVRVENFWIRKISLYRLIRWQGWSTIKMIRNGLPPFLLSAWHRLCQSPTTASANELLSRIRQVSRTGRGSIRANNLTEWSRKEFLNFCDAHTNAKQVLSMWVVFSFIFDQWLADLRPTSLSFLYRRTGPKQNHSDSVVCCGEIE